MTDVLCYANALGVHPSTVIQRGAKLGGATWAKWEAGSSSPTLRTVDKILKYIKENPAVVEGEEPLKAVG